VVEEGARLLDETGPAGFTLAVLASRLGVRTPSLYKHVDGLPALRRSIALRAKRELAVVLGGAAVGRAGDDAVRAMAVAYRRWALAHPGQYPSTQHAPAAGDADDEAASSAVLDAILEVLTEYALEGDDAVHAVRFLRSAFHGFVVLETGGAFELPVDPEHSYARVVDSVVTALRSWGPPTR
jgi:AcrR family transcriptional regulator